MGALEMGALSGHSLNFCLPQRSCRTSIFRSVHIFFLNPRGLPEILQDYNASCVHWARVFR